MLTNAPSASTLARTLKRCGANETDQQYMTTFAEQLVYARLHGEGRRRRAVGRNEHRIRREVDRRIAGLVAAIHRRDPHASYRAALPRTATVQTLQSLAAGCATTREGCREWIHFLRGAIDAGAFAPTIVPGTPIPMPAGGGALPPRRRRETRRPIRHADVVCLERATESERDRLILTLLCATGLRREAVASLRIADVWDDGHVRSDGIRATEKYGEVRTIRPVPTAVIAVLDRYLRSPESPLLRRDNVLLFPGRTDRPDRVGPSLVSSTVRRLCRRAGIHPPFRPHQFRTFAVDDIIQRGGNMLEAARFLGHRSVDVTFKYYYTGHVPPEQNPLLAEAPPTDAEKMDALESLQATRRHLEREDKKKKHGGDFEGLR